MGGMFGAIAILAALYQKRGGNKDGADIRIGLFENCLFLVAQHMVEYEMTGRKPRSMPEREHAWPIYDIFDTAGGERIFIGVVTEGHGGAFAASSACRNSPTIRPCATPPTGSWRAARIIPRVAEVIKGWNIADLSAKLDALNICFSPINRPEDLLQRSACAAARRAGAIISTPTASRSAFRRCRWSGTAAISAKG